SVDQGTSSGGAKWVHAITRTRGETVSGTAAPFWLPLRRDDSPTRHRQPPPVGTRSRLWVQDRRLWVQDRAEEPTLHVEPGERLPGQVAQHREDPGRRQERADRRRTEPQLRQSPAEGLVERPDHEQVRHERRGEDHDRVVPGGGRQVALEQVEERPGAPAAGTVEPGGQ